MNRKNFINKRKKSNILKFLLSVVFSLSLLLSGAPAVPAANAFFSKAEFVEVKSNFEADADMSRYVTAQGACTDGKYLYCAVQNGSTALLKYDLKDFSLIDRNEGITNLGHANDMTYNSKRNIICVANNNPEFNIITIVDPKTLEVTARVTIELEIYSIAYCAKYDWYVVGISGTYDFAILDNKFNVKKEYEGGSTGYTRQGCDCDDNYIYFSQSSSHGNIIVVYNYKGKYITTVAVDQPYEIENIFHSGSNFYATLHYYGNYIYRLGISNSTIITYVVNYAPGDGFGEMKSTVVHYGYDTKLRSNAFSKSGYFFGGWKVFRDVDSTYLGFRRGSDEKEWLPESEIDSYFLMKDEGTVSKTAKLGSITLTPFFISEYYDIFFYADDETDGYLAPFSLPYRDSYELPESIYHKYGYVFAGYTAYRSYDGTTYGYRKGSDKPEWLYPGELAKFYYFREEEKVSHMTYDGYVIFAARFKSAFNFDGEGEKLEEYIGVDEIVRIPEKEKLSAISKDAFQSNDIMTEVHIPASVDIIESEAFINCKKLENIYFADSFAAETAADAWVGCGTPKIYLEKTGEDGSVEHIFLGWFIDSCTNAVMNGLSDAFLGKDNCSPLTETAEKENTELL